MNQKHWFYVLIIVWLLALVPLIPFYSNNDINKPLWNTIKVMSYNIHFGQSNSGEYDIDGIASVIKSQEPNIVGFQEVTYYSPFNGYTTMFLELKSMMESLGFNYFYSSSGYNYNLANTIFSQYEIKSSKTFDFEDWNAWQRNLVETTIDVNGNELLVYTTHLTHVHGGRKSSEVRVSEVTQLIEIITRHDRSIDENIILLGDFNIAQTDESDVPLPEYVLLTSTFKDLWVEAEPLDNGYTSPADDPTERIDYVFSSQTVNATSCEVLDTLASDHLPVTCEISLS